MPIRIETIAVSQTITTGQTTIVIPSSTNKIPTMDRLFRNPFPPMVASNLAAIGQWLPSTPLEQQGMWSIAGDVILSVMIITFLFVYEYGDKG